MTEEHITFATAKLAKEKGFDDKHCMDYYDKHGFVQKSYGLIHAFCRRPTQALLQKWLRKEHKIFVLVLPWKDHAADCNDPYTFRPMIAGIKTWEEFSTWEEALEVGLVKALNLIKHLKKDEKNKS